MFIRKIITLFVLFWAYPVFSIQAQNIKIKGSDTILPIAQEEAAVYNKTGTSSVSVTGGGSGVGLTALADNTTDIAMTSRRIKLEEKMKLASAGKRIIEVSIAKDALSVIVNPQNKIAKLTRQQLEGIYTGKIRNWSQVGGNNMNIVVYGRESSSGTFEFFKEYVNRKKNFAASVLAMPATGAIVQSVAQTKGAIGYIGFAYTNPKVKEIAVSFDEKTYVEPTEGNVKNGTYPIVRYLYFYYTTHTERKVKPFIDFILSKPGQEIVEKVGYISLL